ncbi:MAG: hypothetical protein NVS9B3_10250 [Gemmatimonadaceae bacterium]
MITLAVCLVLLAWLTAASISVRSVSRIWLRHRAETRLLGWVVAEQYLERPQGLLFAGAVASATVLVVAGTSIGVTTAGHPGETIRTSAVAAIMFVLGGHVLPRAAARRWAPILVPIVLPPLRFVEIVSRPIVSLARYLAGCQESSAAPLPGDGLQHLLRDGELEGVGKREASAIISGVVQFGAKVARDVMTPRDAMVAMDEETPLAPLARRMAESAYSRVPIFSGSVDRVIGVVHAFDVLNEEGDRMPPLRSVAFTPPTTPCHELLFDMLRRQRHLAIVRDEGGATVGLVTLEDLLEELVGDIRDEHDAPPPSPLPGSAA